MEPCSVDETLRLMATLPAPEGLAERVQAGLRAAPRSTVILSWPMSQSPNGSFLRGAAAAAIVCVVAGGGWRIYSRIPTSTAPQVLQMPQHSGASYGFGSANARRVPETLEGPVLTHHHAEPSVAAPQSAPASQAEPAKAILPFKSPARPAAKSRKKSVHPTTVVPVQ
jgi:hypothetical protein